MSRVYHIQRLQNIPAGIDAVWEFIASPGNLAKITPDDMGFVVTSEPHQGSMYAGQIITYKVSPIAGIKLSWMTEITHVKDMEYFVDEQRFGPYAFWHHQHFIKPIAGGVEMRDLVHYKIPYGFVGDIVNSLLVKRKLKEIFDFRHKAIEKMFGVYKP